MKKIVMIALLAFGCSPKYQEDCDDKAYEDAFNYYTQGAEPRGLALINAELEKGCGFGFDFKTLESNSPAQIAECKTRAIEGLKQILATKQTAQKKRQMIRKYFQEFDYPRAKFFGSPLDSIVMDSYKIKRTEMNCAALPKGPRAVAYDKCTSQAMKMAFDEIKPTASNALIEPIKETCNGDQTCIDSANQSIRSALAIADEPFEVMKGFDTACEKIGSNVGSACYRLWMEPYEKHQKELKCDEIMNWE